MRAYVGETRARELAARFEAAALGLLVNRGGLGPWPGVARRRRRAERLRGRRWALDNGAFVDHARRRPFDWLAWQSELLDVAELPAELRPDFFVVPDVVADGAQSRALSLEALDWLDGSCIPSTEYPARRPPPRAFVVQDGMSEDAPPWGRFDVVFVGGSLGWKLATGARWVAAAHDRGLLAHVGRVGTAKRVLWARAIGADSIDSSLPLWSTAQADRFLAALDAPVQTRLRGS